MMTRPRRELSVAQRAQFAAQDLFGHRQAIFVEHPLHEINQPPAHDLVNRGDRTGLDHGDERAPLRVVEQGGASRRHRQVGDFSPIGSYLRTMNTTSKSIYRGHRFPAEVIEQAVWLYFRFPLSLRMVEDLLAARGIIVSHETVRCWAEKFGRIYANKIRRRAHGSATNGISTKS